MQTSKNIQNDEDYREKSKQSSQSGSSLGDENYKSQEQNQQSIPIKYRPENTITGRMRPNTERSVKANPVRVQPKNGLKTFGIK